MKILVLMYHGHAGPYVMLDFDEAFSALGHETVQLGMMDIHELCMKIGPVEAYKETSEAIKKMAPDLVIGYGLMPLYIYRMPDGSQVNLFDSLNIPCASIMYDSPIDPRIVGQTISTYTLPKLFMFIWDQFYVDELKLLGFKNVHYLPIASNTKRFVKYPEALGAVSQFNCDVSFVGAWSIKRDIIMAGLKVFNPRIYGYMWLENATDTCKALIARNEEVDNIKELPELYNYSKINVNITMEQGISSLNMRVFDVMACEGFLITDYKKDLEELFDYEKEIVAYRDVYELNNLVGYYLKNEAARKEKARAARKRILREHTYVRRAESILSTMKEAGVWD